MRKSKGLFLPGLFLCLLIVCAALAGCGRVDDGRKTGGEVKREQEEKEDDAVRIGISFDSFVIERWQRDRDVFVSTAQSLGAEVNVQNANGEVNEQIAQIRYLIHKDMDVIVIIAIDGTKLKDVVKEAQEKGIKVVCYDRLILNAGSDLYVSFDNEKVGTLMAEALEDALPDGGNVFEILGSGADNNTSQIRKGFEQELKDSNLKIVYTAYCENWLAELAFDAVNNGLDQTQGQVDGVMCGNDDLAGQAIKALTEHRLAGSVPVVGQDADLSGCQRIVEGTQTMSVYKSVEQQAKIAAQLSVDLALGKDITSEDSEYRVEKTIDDGSGPVPYYSIDPMAVTKENMDSVIIDGGFHLGEDVYMNVGET